jgi:HPt (histidine-containing phosphotransfer) domain-containing protein
MDAYVAKPFRPHELFGAVEGVPTSSTVHAASVIEVAAGPDQSAIAPLPDGPQTTSDEPPTFDRDVALERVGGSETILEELVELFRVECPKQMADIRAQRTAGDLPGLCRAAHTLKGSVGIFAAQPAFDAALRIEQMGRTGNASGFDDAWTDLEREIGKLLSAFDRVFKESARS